MHQGFSVQRLEALPAEVALLEAQAIAEGFRFLTRLVTEWENQTNRFDKPGECLLGVFRQGELIAIGGVSRDPYVGPEVARLRRVYVAPAQRGCLVGKALVQHLLEHATAHFHHARLSTDTPEAAAFYLRCGFHEVADDTATHGKCLR
ncbi:GNAT family N-acetyltransferase [Pseudomonas sp.]|uniref:GNAT family N-acetyltransferase n=1 Tax=Pseudomonas sp. TaxID=306 RepID=UPI003264771F